MVKLALSGIFVYIILLEPLHYVKSSLIRVLSRTFSVPGGPYSTDCNDVSFPVKNMLPILLNIMFMHQWEDFS